MLRLSGFTPLLVLLPEPGLSHLLLLWESRELNLHAHSGKSRVQLMLTPKWPCVQLPDHQNC